MIETYKKARILLVEDDLDSRELLEELLSCGPYEVHTAADGLEGLAMFEQLAPEVLVTDEALPGLRGTLLARRVRERSPGARIILVSGHLSPPGAEACDRVLQKPLELDHLLATLHELVTSGRPAADWPDGRAC